MTLNSSFFNLNKKTGHLVSPVFVELPNGTAEEPSLSFTDSPDSGLQCDTSGAVHYIKNGTDEGELLTTPNVESSYFTCRNASNTVPIPLGTAVMFAGTLGASGKLKVAPMVADGTYPGYVFFGVTAEQIEGASDGLVAVFGEVRGFNTSGFTESAILWCDPTNPGGFTETEPQAPNLKLAVAAAINSKNNGTLFVRWSTGDRLQDLHDVEANGTKSDLDILNWNAANNRWEPTDRLTLLEARVTALETP